ncbi:hypothetical protein BOTNAR_0403g00110 [Botryotinia narcissicola]|uniref:Uncharacterized protein n=1 Tax=Botryotinia narcissicola TaxID=278944 RepID=A0A4Z1HM37_9HELO|nr:hypothetical protein BOTNAR_0403g00110 [Botryotinia narcissicola]
MWIGSSDGEGDGGNGKGNDDMTITNPYAFLILGDVFREISFEEYGRQQIKITYIEPYRRKEYFVKNLSTC